nr:CRISPR-associated endonuclease Cas2 [Paenactinomyces guangxiensis]
MKGMGDHIQYSVFICQLAEQQKVETQIPIGPSD